MAHRPDYESADYKEGYEDGKRDHDISNEKYQDLLYEYCKLKVKALHKEWVGLSDDECIDILVKANKPMKAAPDMAIEFGRAIEQALKEKNNG